ncbi:MAG: Radical domain protein [Acidobacteria bacterium]|nr:Radical domain protein [Acidobacteriota bacterium]
MDYAYIFGDAQTLYLNVTNRCTNRCRFCVRYGRDGLGGSVLWGGEEPDLPLLQHAIQARGGLDGIREFVWCGFGEPTFRLDLIRQAEPWLRSRGAKIRLNTNGNACLIHGRDVLPELANAADEVSISLNAPDCESYVELCRPESGRLSWEGMVDFLKRAPLYFEKTQASIVASVLTSAQIEQCRRLAASFGVHRFLLR